MKKLKVLILTIVILVISLTGRSSYFTFAASQVALSMSTDEVEITEGSSFIVTITFTSKSEAISVIQASLEYDSELLEFQYGGNAVEMSGGTGGISDIGSADTKVMSYNIRFMARKAGNAKIAVTSSEVIGDKSGSILGEPTISKMVKISATKVDSTPDVTNPPIHSEEPSKDDPVDYIEIMLDGQQRYIIRDLKDVVLPEGFEIASLVYKGDETQAAQGLSKDLTLLYIMDDSDYASFYIYDKESEAIYPYININIDTEYTILETIDKPLNCQEVIIMMDGQPVLAWKSDEFGDDFYLVYAMNTEGMKGYYLYDSREGSMQRAITQSADDAPNKH